MKFLDPPLKQNIYIHPKDLKQYIVIW